MMNIPRQLAQFGDRYDRNARLAPALLVLLPAIVLIIALYGTALGILGTIVTTAGVCGGWILLADFARSRGQACQKALWERWGGPPATQLLRYGNDTFGDDATRRYHVLLEAKIGRTFPTSAEQQNDTKAADGIYEIAVNWLLENTRSEKRFMLLKNDNIAYGFRRNGYALRYLGMTISIVCVAWIFLHLGIAHLTSTWHNADQPEKLFSGGEWAPLGVALTMLFAWLFFFTEETVKRAGFSYAKRLILTAETVKGPKPQKTSGSAKAGKEKAPAPVAAASKARKTPGKTTAQPPAAESPQSAETEGASSTKSPRRRRPASKDADTGPQV